MALYPRMSGEHFLFFKGTESVHMSKVSNMIFLFLFVHTFPSILDDIFPLSVPINPEANLRPWCVFAPAKSLGNIVVSQVLNTSITG